MNPEVPDIRPASKYKALHIVLLIVLLIAIVSFAVVVIIHHYNQQKTIAATGATVPVEESITSTGFTPSTVTINTGQSVLWTNYDTKIHTVSSDPYPTDNGLFGFKSQTIEPGQTYSFEFDQKGTFGYHDDLNPTTFKGTIIVK